MASNSLDIQGVVQPEQLALEIALSWDKWKVARQQWESLYQEVRNYVFATDTNTTTAGALPFMNSTTVPKLSQIRMNLLSNYMAHLFSTEEWFTWQAHDNESSLREKRILIESYIRTKARQQGLESIIGDLLDDWILAGNCFCQLEYVVEKSGDPDDDRIIYQGPKLFRISPHDIVFNLAATSFSRAPKIIRKLFSIGEINDLVQSRTEEGWTQELLDKLLSNRAEIRRNGRDIARSDLEKASAMTADGFGDILEYYNSDLVEILEFYGDIWHDESGEYLKNYKIVVVDRAFIIHKEPVRSLTGSHNVYHSGWGRRPDSLMGTGPLDNIVGMQYKIDKLENLRADVFEQIAYPTTVEVGEVRFIGQRGGPGGRYIVDENGSVQMLRPDATALNADLQIAQTMQIMEEMAGSPREAMGFRSPGEKTKFEVQTLENAANRVFRRKVQDFETFLEGILNDMLEVAYRNLNGVDIVRSVDPVLGVEKFSEITADDIKGNGKLYPVGSKQAIRNANTLQNLQALGSGPLIQMVNPHMSRIGLARLIEEAMELEKFALIAENIGIEEDIATQQLVQAGSEQLQEEAATPIEEEDEEVQAGF